VLYGLALEILCSESEQINGFAGFVGYFQAPFGVRFQRSNDIADHVAAQLRDFLPSVFGTGQTNYVLVCVLAIADLKAKPWQPQHPRAVSPACPFGGGHALIKCNADPACLPPNDVTALIAALDIDDKIE
jgi:hypothetical protein